MHINFSDLEKLGINLLTGEACAFRMRALCDLNDKGAALLQDYFGMQSADGFARPWNSQVDHQPAVGSVMLHRDAFPALVLFALFRKGYQYVVAPREGVGHVAFNDADIVKNPAMADYLDGKSFLMEDGKVLLHRNPAPCDTPGVTEGGRNVHQFTKRVL